MKVLMLPYPKPNHQGTSGIDRVVEAYHRHLPEFGIELVHPDADSYDLLAVHAGMTGEVCDVCHCHGLYFTADYPAPEWEYHVNARVIAALRHSRQVTVPSAWVAETLQRDMHATPNVVPHGIDWDDWQDAADPGDYVLWNKNRGNTDMCDPSPVVELSKRFPDVHLVSTFLPRNAPRPQNVSVVGVIPFVEMKKLVKSARVYLATTKETFGLGILEAMASGVPVLGYAHGGVVDLVQHGVNGYLARPGDYDDLAEGLAYCLRNRRVLGANGRELARAWTWEAACEKVAAVYRAALEPELPTVGVVIPVYNKTEEEVRRAVESVTSQTYNQLTEIVVVDDGSTDKGRYVELIEDIQRKDKRVQLIEQPNSGVAHARNRGIGHIRGKYICCLDADDWLEPDFLKVCVKALEADQSLGIAYTGLRYHKPDGETGVSPWPGEWSFDQQLERRNQVPTACVFRREMWRRLGGYRQRYAPRGAGSEDADFWTRAGAYGWKAAKVTEEALFNYSWMSGQVTGDPNYQEPDWLAWHPWASDRQHPFASYATPRRWSHPVRQYDQPHISVVIPVGPGHEREVINALDSLEAQTFRKWEVIIVWDIDAEPDKEGIEQVRQAYPYIREVFHAFNLGEPWGAGKARNKGAEAARAPFLLFLDADDWLYPACLERMVEAWNEHKAIVYTDYVGKAIIGDLNDPTLAPDLRERIYAYDERKQEAVIGYRAADYDCERAVRQPEGARPYIWCNVTALIPKTWHEAVGGFDEGMESWEDVDYHYRHARAGHCYHRVADELMVYRFYTGTRREDGRQKNENLVKYLVEKYKRSQPEMCTTCGSNRRPTTSPSAPFAAMLAAAGINQAAPVTALPLAIGGTLDVHDGDLSMARYNTQRGGDHRVVGQHTHIDYGYKVDGAVFLVHVRDIDGITFIQVDDGVPAPPPAPRVELDEPTLLDGAMETAHATNAAFVQSVDMGPIDEAIRTGADAEELQPFVFEPDTILATVTTLREFLAAGTATPHLLEALLEIERGGKARKTAIDELERALG